VNEESAVSDSLSGSGSLGHNEVPHGFATFHAKRVSTQEIGGVGFSEPSINNK